MFARTISLAATLSWAWLVADAAESADATATAAAPKDYVVFFGLDLFADDGTSRRRVVDASGRELLVMDKDETTPTPVREARLKAEVVPKLSRNGVTLADLIGEPIYSLDADPMAQEQIEQVMVESFQSNARMAADVEMRKASEYLLQAKDSKDPSGNTLADAQQKVLAASARLDQIHATPILRGGSTGSDDKNAAHDGFAVSFQASAPERHARVYGVLRLKIRDPQQPEATLQALKVFRLRELTTKPRKAVVKTFDLPAGFVVESYQVHLYAGGAELATNFSQNRVELTVDEAHQYFIMRHIHLNRSATLPAQILADLAPRAAASKLIAGQESTLVTLGISAEGQIAQVGGDAAISTGLSPQLQAALREVRFLPALANGQPVASTGTFALSELFLSQ